MTADLPASPEHFPDVMNPDQAAKYLGMSRTTLEKYVRKGWIPKPWRPETGRKVLFYKAKLQQMLTDLPVHPAIK